MRVFIIPSWYPNELHSIRGIFFKEQAQSLMKKGFEVVVLYPEIRSLKEYNGFKSIGFSKSVEDEVLTYRFTIYNFLPRLPIYTYLTHRFILRKIINNAVEDNGIPDIFHAHSTLWGGISLAPIAEKMEVPLVVTEHSSAFGRYNIGNFKKKLVKRVLTVSDQFLVVSNKMKIEMEKIHPSKKITVIPNIVNTRHFFIKENLEKNKKFTFFSAGFLNKNKGMDILITAFSQIKNKEIDLIIAGDGEEMDNLKKLTQRLDVENQVTFLGRISREEMRCNMQKCDAFVLSSRYETFGIVYVEALACGKPIIATTCGGPEMIVNERNGYLVENENIAELSLAMKKMSKESMSFDPVYLRQECINKYSEEAVVDQLQKIYSQAVSQKQSKYNKRVIL